MTVLWPLRPVWGRLSQLWNKLIHFVPHLELMRGFVNGVLSRVPLRPLFWAAGPEPRARSAMVVGLGNPGMDGTRHNVGRAVLDSLAVRLGASGRWRGDCRLWGELVVCELDAAPVILLKPTLPMNMNGAAVARAGRAFGVRPEDVLLVHDELDKPLGKVSVKLGGSARGHNGVRSCVDRLGSDVMRRLRVGIGRPTGNISVDRHVLGRFSPDERKVLDLVLLQSVDLLLGLLSPPGGAPDTPDTGGTSPGNQIEEREPDRRTRTEPDRRTRTRPENENRTRQKNENQT